MYSYFAVQGKQTYSHGWQGVLSWARAQIQCDSMPIKLLRARGGDKDAVVIAEITKDEERLVQSGRRVNVRRLMHDKS